VDFYTVRLPLPPSVNHAFPTVRGRRVKSAEYTRWSQEATLLANMGGMPMVHSRKGTAQWSLTTEYTFENWRSDMDNRYKVLIDWLCRRLSLNDNRLMTHHSQRMPNSKETGVLATVAVW
jgi:Holliday junction resolvase RusA-like endonuclease